MIALITGAAGFIGSHLTRALLEAGHEVVAIDNLSAGSTRNLVGIKRHSDFDFVDDDVSNSHSLHILMEKCDAVYHLAAAAGSRVIADHPAQTFETNTYATRTVLDVARHLEKKVLVVSSGDVYGKSTAMPFHEDDDVVLGDIKSLRSSVACSKLADEYLAMAYHQEHGLPVIIVRLFNTIGPRQSGQHGAVVPRFVSQALQNEPLTVYGTGTQARCFAYVGDSVNGLMGLMDCPGAVGGVYNLGTSHEITIDKLADKIIEMTTSQSEKTFVSHEEVYGKHFDDTLRCVPCLDKIHECIGYEPKTSLDQALQVIIEDMRDRL